MTTSPRELQIARDVALLKHRPGTAARAEAERKLAELEDDFKRAGVPPIGAPLAAPTKRATAPKVNRIADDANERIKAIRSGPGRVEHRTGGRVRLAK